MSNDARWMSRDCKANGAPEADVGGLVDEHGVHGVDVRADERAHPLRHAAGSRRMRHTANAHRMRKLVPRARWGACST